MIMKRIWKRQTELLQRLRRYHIGWCLIVLIVFYIILRTFVGELCYVPSESMENTVHPGWQWIDKTSYGCRLPRRISEIAVVKMALNYSERAMAADSALMWDYHRLPGWKKPERMDLVVFYSPKDDRQLLVKRIVALPGDTLLIKHGDIIVNGKMLKMPPSVIETTATDTCYKTTYPSWKMKWNLHNYGPFVVPKKERSYFVLGDNRAHSNDSRYWGLVPFNQIVGRMIVMNK